MVSDVGLCASASLVNELVHSLTRTGRHLQGLNRPNRNVSIWRQLTVRRGSVEDCRWSVPRLSGTPNRTIFDCMHAHLLLPIGRFYGWVQVHCEHPMTHDTQCYVGPVKH
jgi:hypothetical protein